MVSDQLLSASEDFAEGTAGAELDAEGVLFGQLYVLAEFLGLFEHLVSRVLGAGHREDVVGREAALEILVGAETDQNAVDDNSNLGAEGLSFFHVVGCQNDRGL